MEKIISFKKEVLFKNNIEEILSISLDKTLEVENKSVKGLFVISGEYSIYNDKKDKFSIEIPYVDYLEDRYDTNNAVVDIDDFYYEVVGKNKVNIHIDIKIDKLEEIENLELDDEIEDEMRQAPEPVEIAEDIEQTSNSIGIENVSQISEISEGEVEQNLNIKKEEKVTTINNRDDKESDVREVSNEGDTSIFNVGNNMSESYTTYRIYIMREGDTIESLVDKYSVSREILVQYNNLNDVKIGDKIIIPHETN